jgi:pimeloyl-ACP methyl ester carboxylesterase
VNADEVGPPSRGLLWSEMRAGLEFAQLLSAYHWLRALPGGDGHPVIVLPAYLSGDASTRPLRTFLRDIGYRAHGLKLGLNVGFDADSADTHLARLRDIRTRYDRKVSLVGVSLGGVFARELAKRSPHDVRSVITLGSPLRGNPKANNVWQLYEFFSGRKAGEEMVRMTSELPPVPMTAIFSRTDGIVAWPCTMIEKGALAESVEVHGSHSGLAHNLAALFAIADRLAQPEGSWTPFDRSGLKSVYYPDPWRDVPRPS